jgi:hypothetical protein
MGQPTGVSTFRPSACRRPIMAIPCEPVPEPRQHLERCWGQECDIDPMILRMRLLRHRGSLPQALSLEQELLPLF